MKVAILDDYDVVSRGVEAMLSPFSGRVVLLGSSVRATATSSADLVLYDSFSGRRRWGQETGLDALARAYVGVVIYTWAVGEELVAPALAGGARGFLSKRLPAEELVSALERIHAGEVVVSLGDDPVSEQALLGEDASIDPRLSRREFEIVALIAAGLTNKEIAAQRFLGINSVKTYIRSAYRKMGVTSRAQAVVWALDHGMRSAGGVAAGQETGSAARAAAP